jgi:hypothetical protein
MPGTNIHAYGRIHGGPATPVGVRAAQPVYPGEARADFAESVLSSLETGCLKHNGKCLNQSAGLLPGPLKEDLCSDRLQDANADEHDLLEPRVFGNTTSTNSSVDITDSTGFSTPSDGRVGPHRLLRDVLVCCYPMTGQTQGIFLRQPGPFRAARSNGYPKGIPMQMFFNLYRSEIPSHVYLPSPKLPAA